jgi:hypothetical protein
MPKRKRKGGLSGISTFLPSADLTHNGEATKALESESGIHQKSQTPEAQSGPMVKRQKTATTDSTAAVEEQNWDKKYDATGLVPHYTHPDQVPPHLHKC